MNVKKMALLILSIMTSIILMTIPNKVKAVTNLIEPLYFGILEYRGGTTPENMAYAIKNPDANQSTVDSIVGANIWQIVKYNNPSGTGNYTTGNYYCVRAGVGFSNTKKVAEYNISYDLRTEKSLLENSRDTYLQSIANNGYYYNLLALTDLLYLHGVSTEAEKNALLDAALEYADIYEFSLTDSDIEAVQQAAIWYFTNHDDSLFDKLYNNFKEDGENIQYDSWLFYKTLGMSQKQYTSLSDYNPKVVNGQQVGEGKQRQEQAMYLYDYLIREANKNADSYKNGNVVPKTKVTLYTYTNGTGTVQNTQPIILIEKGVETPGKYDLILEKKDKDGKILNSEAKFTVKDGTSDAVPVTITNGTLKVVNGKEINANNVFIDDVYTIKETDAPVGYVKFEGEIVVTVKKEKDNVDNTYKVKSVEKKVIDENGNDVTNTKGNDIDVRLNSDGNIYVGVKNYQNDGSYNLTLVKEDKDGEQLNSTAKFEVNGKQQQVTGRLQITNDVKITSENVLTPDVYTIKELEPPDEYCKFNGIIIVTVTKKNDNGNYKVDDVIYKVTDENGNDITTATGDDVRVHLNEDGNIYVKVKNYQNDGSYNLTLVKEDKEGEQLNSEATFEINGKTQTVVGRLEIAKDVQITDENVGIVDEYIIKELEPPDEYCKFNGIIKIRVTKKNDNGTYKVEKVTYTVTDENGKDITDQIGDDVKVHLNEDGNIYVEVINYQFDLKLVKRIVQVNGTKVPERIEDVDITDLANGSETTADYKLNKNPVSVKKGDIVKYTLRVYNEGQIDGYASEITEDVPEGLEFMWSEKTDDDLEADNTLTLEEKSAIKYNQSIWDFGTINKDTNKVEIVTTDYLAKGKGAELTNDGANLIKAFNSNKGYINTINEKNPDYKEVSVYMKVTSDDVSGTEIRNEAAITEDTDSEGNPVDDRDSDTEKWVKYEDDEDYDRIILQSFDLALRKFIIAVSNDKIKENDKISIDNFTYLKNEDGTYKRAPKVDTSKLNTIGEDGKLITTATYNHTKEPVEVSAGNLVIYMLRVYNEGDIDGYASEIKDHLPPYLSYVDCDFNDEYGWKVSDDGRTVKTEYLDNHMISKATKNEEGKIVLSYKEVPIMCRVSDKAEGKITNIADITVYKDEKKNEILDRDSQIDNVKLPSDKDLPNYKDDETGDYIPGQQDDDDFEKLVVKTFDLALRKFITGVNTETVNSRIPQVKYDKNNNKLSYEHTKVPVDVVTDDTVIYTIRVYNEGEIDGYASEITDDIPDGLQYLPENTLNQQYRWIMYDSQGKETKDVSKATKIKTDYLSKEQGEARMKNGTEIEEEMTENPALLKAFDKTADISEKNPDYADVKVAFKVIEPNSSDRIIVNSAQISEDTDKNGNPVDDIDSIPDEWNEGEDDQDREYIKLNYFDLALRKWVTHAIVIENGTETVTQTGHKPEDNPEDVVKVELHRKKLNAVTVKFKYSIRITNEGDIAGYAKEITDYVPQGLKFVAADNPDWKDEGNNVISTRKLENTLLQPGETADVEVILTWINGNDNMGLKVNYAEISEDYNDRNVPDRDSTPDNKIIGEDDIDDAPVILSISTGQTKIYFVLGLTVLVTIAAGVVMIRRFVL